MIVSANGDPSNVSNFSAGETIPEWRLVPHDNNIGQRNVTPVPFKNHKEWMKAVGKLRFTLKNPRRRAAKMLLVPILPRVLVKRGWKLDVKSAKGEPIRRGSLKLGTRRRARRSLMQLVAGRAVHGRRGRQVEGCRNPDRGLRRRHPHRRHDLPHRTEGQGLEPKRSAQER